MSEYVPWDDDFKPWPLDVRLKHDAGPYPTIVGLIEELGQIATARGYPWELEIALSVVYSVRRAIDAYGEKYRSHGVPPWKIDDWLLRAPKLAKELLDILSSNEGTAGFAPVVDRGYMPGQGMDHPFGPDPRQNLLFVLLGELAKSKPLGEAEARAYRATQSAEFDAVFKKRFDAMMPARAERPRFLELALQTDRGKELMARRAALWDSADTPQARDGVRRDMMVQCITYLCRAVGAHMTLVTGKRRPWVLLVEMTDAILAYVAQYPGAPPYAVGQENAEFKHSIKLATIYEQDMMLGVQLRLIEDELEEREGLKPEERLGLKPTL